MSVPPAGPSAAERATASTCAAAFGTERENYAAAVTGSGIRGVTRRGRGLLGLAATAKMDRYCRKRGTGGVVRTSEERIPQSPPGATTILQLLEIRTRIYLMTHHQHQVPTWRRGWQSITHCGGPSSRQCRQHKETSLAMKLRLPRRSRQQRLALSQFLPLVVRHE